MKLACGVGRRFQRVRGSPRRRVDGVGADKFTGAVYAALSGAGANLSRRSWEQLAAGVIVYTFGRCQLARRILMGYIPRISTKNRWLAC